MKRDAAQTPTPADTVFDLPPVPPSADQEQAAIRCMRDVYGVMAWYGQATRQWWAVCNGQLVKGHHPEQLEAEIIRTQGLRL